MSYAVLWSENGDPPYAGKLQLVPGRLALEGTAGGVDRRTVLGLAEIVAVRVGRGPAERLEGRPVLVLERPQAEDIRIAPLGGAGVLHELVDLIDVQLG